MLVEGKTKLDGREELLSSRQGDRALWPDSARKSDAAITHESVRGDLEDAASRSCKKQGREQLLNWIALLGVDLVQVPSVPDVMDSHGFALNTIIVSH